MNEKKYLVSIQDLHAWWFHELPVMDHDKFDEWLDTRKFEEQICKNKDKESKTFFSCSNCNACSYNFFNDKTAKHVDGINFCPNCGAKVVE